MQPVPVGAVQFDAVEPCLHRILCGGDEDAGKFRFGEGVWHWDGLVAVVGVCHAFESHGAGRDDGAAAVDVFVSDAFGVRQLGDDPAASGVDGVDDALPNR